MTSCKVSDFMGEATKLLTMHKAYLCPAPGAQVFVSIVSPLLPGEPLNDEKRDLFRRVVWALAAWWLNPDDALKTLGLVRL